MLQIQDDYIAIRKGIQGKIEYLQQKRLLNLYPTLYLPPGWQPAVLEPPAILYKVGAARIAAAELPDNHCSLGWAAEVAQGTKKSLTFLLFETQVVAAAGDSFWSVYDGATEYTLGKTTHTKHGASCWPALWGCFFAFPHLQQVCSTGCSMPAARMSSELLHSVHAASYRIHGRATGIHHTEISDHESVACRQYRQSSRATASSRMAPR